MTDRAATATGSRPIRVVSVPAAHPYVEHLAGPGVERLPDPVGPGRPPGRWWPPVALEPGWIRAHAADFDLLHLHFGTESFSPAQLAETVEALRDSDRPLVCTVHDLTNPQLVDQAPHRAHLDVLLPAAAALITLTEAAAAEIAAGWGRTAAVIAHPHVLPLEAPAPSGRPQAAFVVGLHLRDLRPNVDGPGATGALIAAVAELRAGGLDVEVRVELHDHVRDPAARAQVRGRCAEAGWATLVERPRPSDAELVASLVDLDVSVLPYVHGTHSGWVELCWDLGVSVAAPAVGCFAAQHDDPAACAVFTPGAAGSLARALEALLGLDEPEARPWPRPGSPERRDLQARRRAERRVQRRSIAAAHLTAYRAALVPEASEHRGCRSAAPVPILPS